MNCTCITTTNANLTQRLKDMGDKAPGLPKGGQLKSVDCKISAFTVSDSIDLNVAILIPFEVEYSKPSGGVKKHEVTVTAGFCPFCGVSAKAKPAEATA